MTHLQQLQQQLRNPFCALVALAFVGTVPVSAQQASSDRDDTIEEIVILGSRIPARSATDSPVPVDVLDVEEIENTGARETGRAIQAAAPSFNFSSSTVSDGTDALRPATLRGLGPDQTLVLINGRRRHQSALIHLNSSVGRGTAGVDMNAIPVGAVERVEVLRDGASALYGSDAMAGVINLQLKRNGDGKVHFDYGQYSEGDGTTPHVWWHDGWEIGDGGVVTVTASYRDRENTNRAGVDGSRKYPYLCNDGTTLFDNDVGKNPDDATKFDVNEQAEARCGGREAYTLFRADSTYNGAANFTQNEDTNSGTYRIGDADSEQTTVVANLELPIGDSWELLGFITQSSRDNQSAGFWRKPEQIDRSFAGLALPDTADAKFPDGIERYADGYLPLINTTIDDSSFSAGVRGDITDNLSVDVAYTQGTNTFDFFISNSINASHWGVAEDGSTLVRETEETYTDPNTGKEVTKTLSGPSDPYSADAGGLEYTQTAINVDFLLDLTDALGVAFGFESRTEEFSIRAGEDYSWANYGGYNPSYDISEAASTTVSAGTTVLQPYGAGIQVFPGFRPESALSRSRDNIAFYGQVDYSQEKWLVSGALRFEDYSDFGDVLTYKVAGRYILSEDLAIRGALSSGFRAPSMHQLYFSNISTQFVDVGGTLTPQQVGTYTNDSPIAKALGIPPLKEETSNNFSIGLTWDPIASPFSITFDYYSIDISDRVLLSSTLSKSVLPTEVFTRLEMTGRERAQVFYNGGDTSTTGFDIIGSYSWDFASGADLKLSFAYNSNDTTVDSVAVPASLTGVTVNQLFSLRDRDIIENWQPDTRLNLVAELDFNSGSRVYVAARQIGEYNISSSSGDTLRTQTISASLVIDARWTFEVNDDLQIVIGADNITDVLPDTVDPSIPRLRTRAGPLNEPNADEVVVSDNLGIFPLPRGAAPFGINGAYYYAGINYRY